VTLRQFDFYGVGVRVESTEEEFLSAVEHDFSYFLGMANRHFLSLTLTNTSPDYDRLPELTCSFATPRNICFSDERFTYIDYFGQGLNIYDRRLNHSKIITDDLDLAHEIAYLTILSATSTPVAAFSACHPGEPFTSRMTGPRSDSMMSTPA